MSGELLIILQCLVAFGAPLLLACVELHRLRRKPPAPVGGGEPIVVALVPRRRAPATMSPAPASAETIIGRAA